MKIKTLLFLAVLSASLIVFGCDRGGVTSQGPREALISKGFVDEDTWKVVCRGYPLEGTGGIQQGESSKRAALLGAYYYIQETFGDSVAPDRDGRIEKFVMMRDHAVLHYIVHKKGLKKMARRETSPENTPDDNMERKE